MTEIGAVPLHRDKNGIYFCKFSCKACGVEHTANINTEESIALIEAPGYLKKQEAAQ
jgi:hypothetical protein